MGFRQKNEGKHQWDRFSRANRELMLRAGLPYGVIESSAAFIYLLDHRYVGLTTDNSIVPYGPGATYFHFDELMPEQKVAFRELLEICEAAFGDSSWRIYGYLEDRPEPDEEELENWRID